MMRAAALVVVATALVVLTSASAFPPKVVFVPSAVAFSDATHGVLGVAHEGCSRCRGAIEVTSDGGRTWRFARWTEHGVVAARWFSHGGYQVLLAGGASLYSATGSAKDWRKSTVRYVFTGYCPSGWTAGESADMVDTNIDRPWSICIHQPSAGTQEKAVYRGRKRVAYTTGGKRFGGIGAYGYALGIAGAHGGFGIIWESRGTLYVTRDGGRAWHALPNVARPEIDFESWATVVSNGIGYALLYRGGHSRLIETTDAGRTWRVVHRWG